MDVSIVSGDAGILQGLKNTLILVAGSLSIGLTLAIPLAILRTMGHRLAQALVRAFVWFFRGTPLLGQMLLVYYGFGQIEALQGTFLQPMFKEAYFCALFTFCLNTCAYTVEILRGAFVAVPQGEIEAARAAGMSPVRMLRRIVLPGALRGLSTYSREIIFMLHGSVLTSVIIVFDLTGAARIVNSLYSSPVLAIFIAAVLYLAMVLSLVAFVRTLKKRFEERFVSLEESATEMEASA